MSLVEKSLSLVFIVALTSSAAGCAGATTQIAADTSRYPVSMSRGVRDADGSLLALEDREKVGDLLIEDHAFGLLYTAIDLNPKTDISERVNAEVQRTHGDAVVNLSVKNSQCFLNFVYPATLLPIWPGCVALKIHGDIIRKKPRAQVSR